MIRRFLSKTVCLWVIQAPALHLKLFISHSRVVNTTCPSLRHFRPVEFWNGWSVPEHILKKSIKIAAIMLYYCLAIAFGLNPVCGSDWRTLWTAFVPRALISPTLPQRFMRLSLNNEFFHKYHKVCVLLQPPPQSLYQRDDCSGLPISMNLLYSEEFVMFYTLHFHVIHKY